MSWCLCGNLSRLVRVRIERYFLTVHNEREYYYGKEEKEEQIEKTQHPTKTNGSGVKKEV